MYNDLKAIQLEITYLDNRAREFEDWLFDNTQSPVWFDEKNKYDDVLFCLAQKKQKLATQKAGNVYVPETMALPVRDSRRNRGF